MAKRRKTTSSAPPKMEEVTDLEAAPPGKGFNLTDGIIFATFLGLLVGVVVAQLALKEYFGIGLLA